MSVELLDVSRHSTENVSFSSACGSRWHTAAELSNDTAWRSISHHGAAHSSAQRSLFVVCVFVLVCARYLAMFQESYKAVEKHLKSGHWYLEANMNTGRTTHAQFNSLQAFWPGLQVGCCRDKAQFQYTRLTTTPPRRRHC